MKVISIQGQNIVRLKIVNDNLLCYHENGTTTSHNINGLEILECWNNQLVSLPDLTNLGSLKIFGISINRLTSLPFLPDSLRVLNCSHNKLLYLPSLPHGLETLYCSGNPIISFPPFPTSLKVLGCCDMNDSVILPPLPAGLEELECDRKQLDTVSYIPDGLKKSYCYGVCNPHHVILLKQHNDRCIQLGIKQSKTLPNLKTILEVKERHTLWSLRIDGEKYNNAFSLVQN